MFEPTLSQVMQEIQARHKTASDALARMSAAEWRTTRGQVLCNREKELHIALVVLLELAAENAPQASSVAASH